MEGGGVRSGQRLSQPLCGALGRSSALQPHPVLLGIGDTHFGGMTLESCSVGAAGKACLLASPQTCSRRSYSSRGLWQQLRPPTATVVQLSLQLLLHPFEGQQLQDVHVPLQEERLWEGCWTMDTLDVQLKQLLVACCPFWSLYLSFQVSWGATQALSPGYPSVRYPGLLALIRQDHT